MDQNENLPENRMKNLLKMFGLSTFKSDVQKKAVEAVMEGVADTFVRMPTGSGKSLVFQLPAASEATRVTIVVSPLLALITDQLKKLTENKIPADTLNSKMNFGDRARVLNDLNSKSPTIKLLYVTPEMCSTARFRTLLKTLVKNGTLARIVIDEAHTVDQWGDFRADYRKLGDLRNLTFNVQWVALTATASTAQEATIKLILKFRDGSFRFSLPCFRDNLFYDVSFKHAKDVSKDLC